MADAIVRTLFRLFVSRRNLLEWVTAAQAQVSPRLDLAGFYRRMSGGVVIGRRRCDRRCCGSGSDALAGRGAVRARSGSLSPVDRAAGSAARRW